jgi:hypothetical protein
MIVEERRSQTKHYMLITHDKVQQAFENIKGRWVRTELKGALLDLGVPGTRADNTQTLSRRDRSIRTTHSYTP